MQSIQVGQYLNEVGLQVYLCNVRMLDAHNRVSWEVAASNIQAHELASFHLCPKCEVQAVPIVPDWSRLTAALHIDAGVPALDTLSCRGKRHLDLGCLFYCLLT